MIEYTDVNIIKLLKKYEMLSNSINLFDDLEQKNNVFFEMTKILNKILELTNDVYEEEFHKIDDLTAVGFEEEKNKLLSLIELITKREEYINSLISKHYIYTSKRIDEPSFLGKYDINEYKNKIELIDNYNSNLEYIEKCKEEIDKIDLSISLAKEKIEISNSLNNELEVKFKDKFDNLFKEYNYFGLKEEKEDIYKIYNELEFILSIAEENIKINNSLSYEVTYNEQNDYEDIEEKYQIFKEKIVLLELMDIYDKKAKTYEELIEKRNTINEIINKIPNSPIFFEMNDFLKEQYTLISKQKEDILTLNTLEEEKKIKLNLLERKIEENNSDIYKEIIDKINEREEKIKEEKIKEQKREEELQKQRMIVEQQQRKEEILKRQKLIEEERKKDMEERAKKLLEEQNKFKKNTLVFENQEDNINKDNSENINSSEIEFPKEEITFLHDKIDSEEDSLSENPLFLDIKNEIEIEDAYNNKQNENIESNLNSLNNVLPKDLDDYMKNFNISDKEVFDENNIFVDF